MAGSDQSRNLGGMMSQIGNTLSSTGLGSAFKDLMVNTQAPAIDPMDPASLDRASQYAARTGNAQNAALYSRQAETLRSNAEKERQRLEAERKEAIAQAGNGMVNNYAKAVREGEGQQEAYDNLMQFASNAGMDVTAQVERIDQGMRAAQDQEWQAEQRAKAEKAENARQMATGAMSGKSESEIQQIITKAPEDVKDVYQQVASRELQFQNQVAQARERDESLTTPPSTANITSAIGSIKNEENKARFQAELDALEDTKKNYWDESAGRWKSMEAKRQYLRQQDAIHRGAFNAGTAEIVAAETRAIQQEEDFQRALGKARSNKVTETEIENYTNAVAESDGKLNLFGYGKIDRAEAIAGVLAEREKGVREAYGRAEREAAEGYTIGQIEDGYKYIGGNPEDPQSWEAVE
jgi:hypothetical protein